MRAAVRVVFRRRRRQRIFSAFFGSAPREEPSLPPGAEAQSELRELFGVLSTLPAPVKVAWTLRHVEDYALPDVALACDCSLATVKRRLADADEVIRRRLGTRAGQEGG
jgi:RNA polymerase sigma-70 factor (ECF subfamily)